jgi:hypothetical protein
MRAQHNAEEAGTKLARNSCVRCQQWHGRIVGCMCLGKWTLGAATVRQQGCDLAPSPACLSSSAWLLLLAAACTSSANARMRFVALLLADSSASCVAAVLLPDRRSAKASGWAWMYDSRACSAAPAMPVSSCVANTCTPMQHSQLTVQQDRESRSKHFLSWFHVQHMI